jgi:hypothetical protein
MDRESLGFEVGYCAVATAFMDIDGLTRLIPVKRTQRVPKIVIIDNGNRVWLFTHPGIARTSVVDQQKGDQQGQSQQGNFGVLHNLYLICVGFYRQMPARRI